VPSRSNINKSWALVKVGLLMPFQLFVLRGREPAALHKKSSWNGT
jgi:hypothetical protein